VVAARRVLSHRAHLKGTNVKGPATQPGSPHRPLPEKIELPSAGPKSPPMIEFLGPTFEPVRRMEKSGRVGLSAPSGPIQGTRLLAQAMPPASAVPFWPINPFGGAHQMEREADSTSSENPGLRSLDQIRPC
jgi:hypothetical protein